MSIWAILSSVSMMIENLKKQKKSMLDNEFDLIYSSEIRALSSRHWTPVDVTKAALEFLCYKENLNIVDVGSGVGKFCIGGAWLKPKCFFYGIDYRESFIDISTKIKNDGQIDNVHFIHNDFSKVDFSSFDGIYFFNSFQEKIDDSAIIDEFSKLSYELYRKYTQDLFLKLNAMPEGTRLVTYHTKHIFIPYTYRIVKKSFDNKLKFYIKCNEVD